MMLHSPFNNILYTNIVPSTEQCDAIRGFLTKPREDASKLDEEVSRLEELLSAAIQKRNELREAISAHEALLSPFRQVPDDVLREVFLRTLPDGRNAALSGTEGPLLLASVCKRWNDIALSMPCLWASMCVVVPTNTSKITPLCDTITTWLQRSGIVPVKISIRHPNTLMTSGRHDPRPAAIARVLWPTLLAVSRRWKKLQIAAFTPEELTPLSGLSAAEVPLLEHVHLFGSQWENPSPDLLQTVLEFLNTSSLRSFTFEGNLCPLPQSVQWANLLHLKIAIPPPQFIPIHGPNFFVFPFPFLVDCQLLETLHIALKGYTITFPPIDAITLPHLTNMNLSTNLLPPREDGAHLFDVMKVPALCSLQISASFSGNIEGFFRAICLLKHLHMEVIWVSSVDLAVALNCLQLLEELHLIGEPTTLADAGGTGSDDNFLSVLMPIPTTASTRCPALRRLRLHSVRRLKDSHIVEFLNTRMLSAAVDEKGIARLTQFSCVFERKQQVDVMAHLSDGVKDGMVVELTYRDHEVFQPKYSALDGIEWGVVIESSFTEHLL
ncbi:hypothetical protein C8F01DRAFT_1045947 [Mycena amicta]|nr:hypothetical protein C8F01DRAFT_1045947 [Mycena amicta]